MPNHKTLRTIGSRRQVFNGSAQKTSGGLTKDDLLKNNAGRIVSAKRHHTMKNRIAEKDSKTDENQSMFSLY